MEDWERNVLVYESRTNPAAKCAFFIIAQLCNLEFMRLLVWTLHIAMPMLTVRRDIRIVDTVWSQKLTYMWLAKVLSVEG